MQVEATSATKDHIVGGVHRLVQAAVVAVQGVAHLVGDGEHGVQRVLLVQEYIGVGPGVAGGVGPGALAPVFVHVDPALVKALFQKRRVVLPQHGQGLQHGLLCLVVGDLHRRVPHHRGVDVVHVQLLHAQQLFPQGDIAVHLVQVPVHGLDEIVVHALRHLGAVQGGGQGGGITPRLGKEAEGLELRVQGGGHGVAEIAVAPVAVFKGALSQGPVLALHQRAEGAGGEGVAAAVCIHGVVKAQVRVAQGRADGVRAVRHLPGGGQQLFLLVGEDVGFPAADAVEAAAPGLQRRALPVEAVQGLVVDGHDLGRGEGRGSRHGHDAGVGAAAHILVPAVRQVLVALAVGIAGELCQAHGQLVVQLEKVQQAPGPLGQGTGEGGDCFGHRHQRLILGAPGLVAFKDIAQVPGVRFGDFAARGDFVHVHGFPPKNQSWAYYTTARPE